MGMIQGDISFELSWWAGGWWSIVMGGTPEGEASFRGQLVIMKLKGGQTSFSGCYTQCVIYSVYVVLAVCCTQCQLMIMAWRDWDTLLSFECCDDSRVVHETEWDGGCRWDQCGGSKQIWQIRGTPCLIGLGQPCISAITRQIGTFTSHIEDDNSTRTRNSLFPHM